MADGVRIDKWLWAVRLFKTRTLAATNCSAGKVKRAGTSLKPSAKVSIGDVLTVPTPDGTHKRIIKVKELLDKRVGAPIAAEAYTDETPKDVIEEAKQVKKEKRINRLHRKEGDQGRMTKKQRRDWRKGLHSHKNQDEQA